MKLSQKQAELLAGEILSKLKLKNKYTVSPLKVDEVQEFVEYRDSLLSKRNEINAQLAVHDRGFKKLVSNHSNIYASDSSAEIIRKLSEKEIPTHSQVTDKIILKSMFASSDDMEAFMDIIAAEFAPKKTKVKV